MNAPLISYIVPCYNEETYLEKAIMCAFEQTYAPLEIILSDNASTDRTLEIMHALAADYDGPHDVRVIRQIEHCNVCEHTNRLIPEIRGDFVIQSSGDDLQDPLRTEKVAELWRETGASMIGNNLAKVNADATEVISMHRSPTEKFEVTLMEILDRGSHNACTGAAQAWDPRLFDRYGPLPDWYHTSDLLVPFWGALEGGCAFISEPLTYFRITGRNTGLGSQHMAADDVQKRVLEEKMHADVAAQVILMRRQLEELQEAEPDRLDYEACFDTLQQTLVNAAIEWSDAREHLVKVEAQSETVAA